MEKNNPQPTDPRQQMVASDQEIEDRIARFLSTPNGRELQEKHAANVISDITYQESLAHGVAELESRKD